jgi:hypothetical protein
LSDGVTGNTSGFGPEESRFEPWSDNRIKQKALDFQQLRAFCFLSILTLFKQCS